MKGLFLSALPLLAAGSPVIVDTIHNDVAPLTLSANAIEVPDSYMVVFKKHVTKKAAAAHHLWIRDIHEDITTQKMELRKRSQTPFQDTIFEGLKHTYNIPGGFQGYSGHFHEDVIEQVRRHPDVSHPAPINSSSSDKLASRVMLSAVSLRGLDTIKQQRDQFIMAVATRTSAHLPSRLNTLRRTQKSTPCLQSLANPRSVR